MKGLRIAIAMLTALLLITSMGGALAEESVTIQFPVEKRLTGAKPETAEEFTFILSPVDGAPMPASSEVKISGAGTAAFAAITFTQPGDYEYTIREAAGGAAGYTYDSRVYTVTVQVTSDESGRLYAAAYMRATGETAKTDTAIFTNRYRNNADIPKTGYGEGNRSGALAAIMVLGALGAGLCARGRATKRERK